MRAARDGEPERWAPKSRAAWKESFERWNSVRAAMLECASGWQRMIPTFERVLQMTGCSEQVQQGVERVVENFTEGKRFHSWERDVQAAIAAVDAGVGALPAWARCAEGAGSESELFDEGLLHLLESLSEAGTRLKRVFGGKGYFFNVNAD